MFDRWHGFKPNRVKPALSQAIIRIGLTKNKRTNAIRNAKKQVAEYLKAGKIEKARIEAERIVRDDFMIEAYDILELMCELVRDNVKSIEAEEKCPFDLIEAVSTLLYASTRTEISELSVVKKQLTYKYGKDFVEGALANRGGVVNERVLHRMSGQRPNAFLVLSYMKEVAHANNVDWQPDELTAAAGERFDAPMVGPDGSSVLPGAGSGLGAGAYSVTDGRILNPGEELQKDTERFAEMNNSIVDNTSGIPTGNVQAGASPPEAPKVQQNFGNTKVGNAPTEDALDLDSLTARFQAFKDSKNDQEQNINSNETHAEASDDLEFAIPIAPTHEVAPTVDSTQGGGVQKINTNASSGVTEDKGAIPKYDELLNRFAKLKSNK